MMLKPESPPKQRENASIRFSDAEVARMRLLLAGGATLDEVADEFHTSKEYMRLIKNNLRRRGVGVDASQVAAVIWKQSKQKHLFIRALRLAGYAPREIAERSGLTHRSVNTVCRQFGLPKWHVKMTPLIKRLACALYANGWTQTKIAQHLGVSPRSVSNTTRGFIRGGD